MPWFLRSQSFQVRTSNAGRAPPRVVTDWALLSVHASTQRASILGNTWPLASKHPRLHVPQTIKQPKLELSDELKPSFYYIFNCYAWEHQPKFCLYLQRANQPWVRSSADVNQARCNNTPEQQRSALAEDLAFAYKSVIKKKLCGLNDRVPDFLGACPEWQQYPADVEPLSSLELLTQAIITSATCCL